MNALLDLFLKGGTAAQAMGAAGGLAALLGLILLLGIVAGARSGFLRGVAVACLLFSAVAVWSGVVESWRGRQAADAAASSERLGKGERIRRAAYVDARALSALGLKVAGGPFILALLALRVAGRRRWLEEHDTPPPGGAFTILLFLAELVGCSIAAYFWKGPLPGRELDEAGWRLVDLRDALDAKDWSVCLSTDLSLDPGSPARGLGEWRDNQARCAKHFITTPDPENGRANLQKLLAARWFEDKDQRRLVQQKVDEGAPQAAPAPAAVPAPAPPPPDPALARVQMAASGCFRKPVELRLAVSKAGKILEVKAKGSSRENAPGLKCLLKAAKAIAFAPGEERAIDVVVEKR